MGNNIKNITGNKNLLQLLKENIKTIKNKNKQENSSTSVYFLPDNFDKYLDYEYLNNYVTIFSTRKREVLKYDKDSDVRQIYKYLAETDFKGKLKYQQIWEDFDLNNCKPTKTYERYSEYIRITDSSPEDIRDRKVFISNSLKHRFRLKHNMGPRLSKLLNVNTGTRDIDWSNIEDLDYSSLAILNALLCLADESSFITFIEPDYRGNSFVEFEEPFKVNLLMAWRELNRVGEVKYISNNLPYSEFATKKIKVKRTRASII